MCGVGSVNNVGGDVKLTAKSSARTRQFGVLGGGFMPTSKWA